MECLAYCTNNCGRLKASTLHKALTGLVLTVMFAALVVGCSNGGSKGTSVSLGPNCNSGFSLSTSMNLPHAVSPEEAIRLFFLNGTTDLLRPTPPSEYGLPSSGWEFVWRKGNTMEYKSGSDILYLSQIGNSYWEVDGGTICTS